jgi:DNA gyrase subunit B
MAGYASRIFVKLCTDGSIIVDDDGRGIPTAISKDDEKQRSGLEIALSEVHAGGKYDKNAYKISGGLNGVGVKAVNALSEQLQV